MYLPTDFRPMSQSSPKNTLGQNTLDVNDDLTATSLHLQNTLGQSTLRVDDDIADSSLHLQNTLDLFTYRTNTPLVCMSVIDLDLGDVHDHCLHLENKHVLGVDVSSPPELS